MIKLCRVHTFIWPQGGVGGGPKSLHLINPSASQVMSPTDLPQCHQHPGDSEKLLDHESTQILGLECPLQDLGLKLQLRSGRMLAELIYLHVGNEEASRERFLYESKKLSKLLINENFREVSWKRLLDPFEQNSPCKQNSTSIIMCNKSKPISPRI